MPVKKEKATAKPDFLDLFPREKPYLTFKELDEKQKKFFYFLMDYVQVSVRPHPETSVGSLCAYLQDCLEGKENMDNSRLEFYDFLTWRNEE